MILDKDLLNYKIAQALKVISPNAEWSLLGNDYDDLVWLSDGDKPTWSQVEAQINNPAPTPEPTVENKLSSVGLNLEDLKAALGL
jgi:hypothetical protein